MKIYAVKVRQDFGHTVETFLFCVWFVRRGRDFGRTERGQFFWWVATRGMEGQKFQY